jgi:hypothetical protein
MRGHIALRQLPHWGMGEGGRKTTVSEVLVVFFLKLLCIVLRIRSVMISRSSDVSGEQWLPGFAT